MTHQIEESMFLFSKLKSVFKDGAQEMTPRSSGLNFTVNSSHGFRSSYQIHFSIISL